MAKIIAFASQKGGVAKTTTSIEIACAIRSMGYKVLAIDMDPQGNLSDGFSADSYDKDTIYEAMRMDLPVKAVIQHCSVDVIPANIMLAGLEMELNRVGKELRLSEVVAPILGAYDYIVIDCPPSLSLLTVNALTASDIVVIPATPDPYAIKGMRQLKDTVDSVKKYCNRNLVVAGIAVTKTAIRKTNISAEMEDVIDKMAELFETKVFKTRIPTTCRVVEAQAAFKPLHDYLPENKVVKAYDSLAAEIINDLEV